jgi:hypothetical protein
LVGAAGILGRRNRRGGPFTPRLIRYDVEEGSGITNGVKAAHERATALHCNRSIRFMVPQRYLRALELSQALAISSDENGNVVMTGSKPPSRSHSKIMFGPA